LSILNVYAINFRADARSEAWTVLKTQVKVLWGVMKCTKTWILKLLKYKYTNVKLGLFLPWVSIHTVFLICRYYLSHQLIVSLSCININYLKMLLHMKQNTVSKIVTTHFNTVILSTALNSILTWQMKPQCSKLRMSLRNIFFINKYSIIHIFTISIANKLINYIHLLTGIKNCTRTHISCIYSGLYEIIIISEYL